MSRTDVPPPPDKNTLHVLAVLLLSAYPLSLMLRASLGVVPISFGTMLWVLVANLVVVAILFVALRLLTTNLASRAAWLCVFLLVFSAYNLALQAAAALKWRILPEDPIVAWGYAGLSAAIATVTVRPWRIRKRDPIPMIIVGIVLVGANAVAGVSRALSFSSFEIGSAGWRPAAAKLISDSTPTLTGPPSKPVRDIYYVVLDGFGSPDSIQRIYGIDLHEFTSYLQARGFHLVPKAQSNYGQTYLSLASTLNLGYLDDVAAAAGRGNSDRAPLAYLIDRNALMALAKQAGYRIIGIGSDYIATEQIPSADICRCEQYGSSMTEQAVLATTPLVGVSLGARAFDAHRRKVLSAFEELQRPYESETRSFVFAHLIAPHPPFVFEADGGRPKSFGLFVFQDGSAYPGSHDDYLDGYRRQVQFVAHQIRALIDTLLSRPGPPPAIVIHGDHGPGLMLDWDSAERTDTAERLGVFAAYYLPEARDQPYETMTLVNGARLLANEYLGTNLPRLDDRSFYSTWDRPYDFVPVPVTPVETERPRPSP